MLSRLYYAPTPLPYLDVGKKHPGNNLLWKASAPDKDKCTVCVTQEITRSIAGISSRISMHQDQLLKKYSVCDEESIIRTQ